MTRASRFLVSASGFTLIYLLLLLEILPTPLIPQQAKQEILPTVRSTFYLLIPLLSSPFIQNSIELSFDSFYLSTQLPWWGLISVGSYLLWNMGWGIFNFNDVPQAYEDLMVVSRLVQADPLPTFEVTSTPLDRWNRSSVGKERRQRDKLDLAITASAINFHLGSSFECGLK